MDLDPLNPDPDTENALIFFLELGEGLLSFRRTFSALNIFFLPFGGGGGIMAVLNPNPDPLIPSSPDSHHSCWST